MPFKIVQTLEKGQPRLSVVPSIWEEKGKLFWPPEKVKNRARLVRDEKSLPSPNWAILDCLIKRKNISTYEEAEAELEIMENRTDTDNDTAEIGGPGSRPALQNNNFENLANDLIHNTISVDMFSYPNNENTTRESLNMPMINVDQLLVNQNLMLQKMYEQDKILNEVVENIKKLSQKVVLLSMQLDDSSTKILEKIEQPVSVTLLKDSAPEENESFCLKQIENQSQFEILETALIDKAERTKLRKQLSFLCQPSEGNGVTFAYKLLDVMISREFLCKCSWSGGSRGDCSKIAMKDFKNFLKFFCDMIRSWDPKFTIEHTETFFKNILKNAVKRKSMRDLRSSSKRTRKPRHESKDNASTSINNLPKTGDEASRNTKNLSDNSPETPNTHLMSLNNETEDTDNINEEVDEESIYDLC